MNYIGMDIHKQFTVAVAKDAQGAILAEDKFTNSPEHFTSFLTRFAPEETKIVIESTSVWEYIYDLLEQMRYEVKLANPKRTRAIAEARIKTDKVDAAMLADLLRANLVAESYIPPKEVRQLREHVRERKSLVKYATQFKNRIHAVLLQRGISLPTATLCKSARFWLREQKEVMLYAERYLSLLEQCEEQIEKVEARIREISEKNAAAQLLMTIPGIGSVRALAIASEIGDITRFPTAEKLCSYAGLVPSVHQSGSTLRFGRLIKESSTGLKYVFVEASWTLAKMKESNLLQIFYKRLVKRKCKQKAICATARKLCTIVHAMLSKKREFMVL